ncbi:MAG: hypothetical protein KDD64_11480 [Bdellovibrionales bacterium]|nr:hypothetical protein [Bdellovibrionales bacterium]
MKRVSHLIFSLALFLFPGVAFSEIVNPIVFVTQVPQPDDFATIGSTFANHRATMASAPRGGDLYIRYADGTLKNLTAAAGYGKSGFQDERGIVVRDPAVHFSGQKVVFSMAIGAPERYDYNDYRFQLYEVTGLGPSETPVISKVPFQPPQYNNIMPAYLSDDSLVFVSDRPRDGSKHLYPQLDEYESTPTNTGLWKLDPIVGKLQLLDHAPSGDFHPKLDSFGRIIFTRWDHLQQDQQAETDANGAFLYASEAKGASISQNRREVFPEARSLVRRENSDESLHTFNQFFPWMIHQNGEGLETLNHVGRHEFESYFDRSFQNDNTLKEYNPNLVDRSNEYSLTNMFHLREDPTHSGRYYAINAPEFKSHSSGQIVSFEAPPELEARYIQVQSVTHPDTSDVTSSPASTHSGLYRDPLPLSDGSLVAVHTSETAADRNIGSDSEPQSRYDFQLKKIEKVGNYFRATDPIVSAIHKSVSYYNPDTLIQYSGPLWQLQPVEVVARERPAPAEQLLEAPERDVFEDEEVSLTEFQDYLKGQNLALVVSRNVTRRDQFDKQQPFSLKVSGGGAQTLVDGVTSYSVHSLQFFQGNQVRGYTLYPEGRRVLARYLTDSPLLESEELSGISQGSVKIFPDGSTAALVPAQRALSWQLVAQSGSPVVRERYWVTFQPGEVRVCATCHGLTAGDQFGRSVPTNRPDALRALLRWWKSSDRGESQTTLRLSGQTRSNRAFKSGKLFGGGRIRLQFLPGSSLSGEDLILRAVKGNDRCDFYSMNPWNAGSIEKRGKLARVSGKGEIQFLAILDGQIVAETDGRLRGKRGRKRSRARSRFSALCSSLKRLR